MNTITNADGGRPTSDLFFNDAQLEAELRKCEYCETKPCKEACPCDCSPADFIKAAEVGSASDLRRSAAAILGKNPLGGICGMVCPDRFCMAACVHKKLDGAVKIPEVQAWIVEKAKRLGVMPSFAKAPRRAEPLAVIGGGPAGLGAAAFLAQQGYAVTIFERNLEPGGMCTCIPDFRLEKRVLHSDIAWCLSLGDIALKLNAEITDPLSLLERFSAVVVATGLWAPVLLGIEHEELATSAIDFLRGPVATFTNVVVIGGGATAFDCAMTALGRGARRVEMFTLEKLSEMPLTRKELDALLQSGIEVNGRVRTTAIREDRGRITGLDTIKVRLKEGMAFHPRHIEDTSDTEARYSDVDQVIVAIGLRSSFPRVEDARVFYAGDCAEGPTTVVEATAAGKNTGARVHAFLQKQAIPSHARNSSGHVKSRLLVEGYNTLPVPLQADFFGRRILSPFLLSAAPPTDGLEQMRKAYRAGWAGGIMKTAFDGVPIHIPGEYMFAFDGGTYANCDNVSGHSLDRVCREVEELVCEFPDRLTVASTGGPVTGDDASDSRQWQGNTRKLESAGAMAVEYSLSCPQGGDGTEGDIVSQNAQLSAKIVDWVLSAGTAEVPKLFKLTGAVTSVQAIVAAIKATFARHPGKKAGITLANSFPTLAFRPGQKKEWDEGVIVGASGAGILHISYLSLAKVAGMGVVISGNGGPMDYRAAANFLALGARTVQFCTLVTKYGTSIIDEMHSGLSHLLAERGLRSVEELIGIALPQPVTSFPDLPSRKKISSADRELCLRCGNCSRCPYMAIDHDAQGYPITDPSRCVGCSICALKCFAKAIQMKERSPEEIAALKEA